MFLSLVLLCIGAATLHPPHPLEALRLTPDQMFHLQVPYRFKVSIAEIERDGLGRWEIQTHDYYCNDIKQLVVNSEPAAVGPPSPLRRNAIRGHLVLQLDDVLSFPDDRYSHLDGFLLVADGEYLLVIMDRLEKRTLWPLPTPDP